LFWPYRPLSLEALTNTFCARFLGAIPFYQLRPMATCDLSRLVLNTPNFSRYLHPSLDLAFDAVRRVQQRAYSCHPQCVSERNISLIRGVQLVTYKESDTGNNASPAPSSLHAQSAARSVAQAYMLTCKRRLRYPRPRDSRDQGVIAEQCRYCPQDKQDLIYDVPDQAGVEPR